MFPEVEVHPLFWKLTTENREKTERTQRRELMHFKDCVKTTVL